MKFDNADAPRNGRKAQDHKSGQKPLVSWLEGRNAAGSVDASPANNVSGTTATGPARAKPPRRRGEDPRLWFRTERVFFQNGGWYIATREGIDVGPYASAEAARRDESVLIRLLTRNAQNGFDDHALVIRQFITRPRHGH
jgi:hypothetical protein